MVARVSGVWVIGVADVGVYHKAGPNHVQRSVASVQRSTKAVDEAPVFGCLVSCGSTTVWYAGRPGNLRGIRVGITPN